MVEDLELLTQELPATRLGQESFVQQHHEATMSNTSPRYGDRVSAADSELRVVAKLSRQTRQPTVANRQAVQKRGDDSVANLGYYGGADTSTGNKGCLVALPKAGGIPMLRVEATSTHIHTFSLSQPSEVNTQRMCCTQVSNVCTSPSRHAIPRGPFPCKPMPSLAVPWLCDLLRAEVHTGLPSSDHSMVGALASLSPPSGLICETLSCFSYLTVQRARSPAPYAAASAGWTAG